MVLVPEVALRDLDSRRPDIAAIRAVGGNLAVSSESGPDGSGAFNVLAAARLAVNRFQLTPYEALSGITLHAARALGLSEQVGSIAVGKRGDLVVFDAEMPDDLVRRSDMIPRAVIAAGHPAHPF